jgi:LDH2 family malate/lactate/ureidoglycolate dehydrogenase
VPDAVYKPEDLRSFCRETLSRLGVPEDDARVVADCLVRANLEGTDSHGVGRLGIYAKRLKEGRISPSPSVEIVRAGSVLRVDGDNGLGQVVSHKAVLRAIDVSSETGIVGVGVRNSNHFGTASYFCQMACDREVALIATTNSPPGIAPWGGKRAYLGTNPIAFGFPTKDGPPLIVDMSSSVVARGNIILAAGEGSPIPPGWAADENGVETTDAVEALKGSMLPLGGPKGYALALAVEVMSAVLSGAAFGPGVNNLYEEGRPPANVGHCFIVMNLASWLPLENYYENIERLLQEIKASPRAEGTEEILYPGERRHRSVGEKSDGIRLTGSVAGNLSKLGDKLGVEFPDRTKSG